MAICTLVGRLRGFWPMPRPIALIICLSGLLGLFIVTSAVFIPPFIYEFNQLLQKLPEAARAFGNLLVEGIDHLRLETDDYQIIPQGQSLVAGLGNGFIGLLGMAGNVGNAAIQLLFIVAISLMISIQPNSYRYVGILLIPSFYRRRANKILDLCGSALSNWMIGLLISSLAVVLLCGIALSLLGVKLVFANALLAGLLNIIPNLGPTISTVFPMAVALLDAPWKAAAVLGVYILIQNIESYIITPSVMHNRLNLLPGLTLASQFMFTVMFGPLGLLMALPLAVVFQVLIKEIVVHDILDRWKIKRYV